MNQNYITKIYYFFTHHRHSNSTIMYRNCKTPLNNIRNEILHKALLQNVKEETVSDANETTLDAVDRKFELNSAIENPVKFGVENAATGPLAIDCKPIVSMSSGKPIKFQNLNLHVDLTNIDTITKPKPHDTSIPIIDLTSDVFHKMVEPIAESTKIASNWSSQMLITCSPIAQAANVPRNVPVSGSKYNRIEHKFVWNCGNFQYFEKSSGINSEKRVT